MRSAVVALAVILLAAVPPMLLRAGCATYGSRVKTRLVMIVHDSHVDPKLPWTAIFPMVIGFGWITQDFILVGVVISKSAAISRWFTQRLPQVPWVECRWLETRVYDLPNVPA